MYVYHNIHLMWARHRRGHKNKRKTLLRMNLYFLENVYFRKMVWGNVFGCCWCVLYSKLL